MRTRHLSWFKRLLQCLCISLLIFTPSCVKSVRSPTAAQSDLCEGQVYQLIHSDDKGMLINDESYWLLEVDCDAQQMTLIKVLMGNKVSDRTIPIKIKYAEGVITTLDQEGYPTISNDFPTETLFYDIPQENTLILDADDFTLTFQKYFQRVGQ